MPDPSLTIAGPKLDAAIHDLLGLPFCGGMFTVYCPDIGMPQGSGPVTRCSRCLKISYPARGSGDQRGQIHDPVPAYSTTWEAAGSLLVMPRLELEIATWNDGSWVLVKNTWDGCNKVGPRDKLPFLIASVALSILQARKTFDDNAEDLK